MAGSTVCLSSAVVLIAAVLCSFSTIPTDAARQRSEIIPDIASTVYSENLHGDRKCYERRVRDPNVHISARLLRYFTFGGILQGIAEKSALPRVGLVQGGASQYQDRSSGLQREYHAAHIVRVGTIEPRLQKESATLYNALKNYIGHTQNVIRHANVWHGVGGQIDRFQSDSLTELAKIDFNGTLDGQIQTVEGLVMKFRELIQKYVQAPDGARTESDQSVLNEDWAAVWCAGTEVLFEAGKEGYQLVMSGNFADHYTAM